MRSFLSSIPVSSFPAPPIILTVESSETPAVAFAKLCDANFLSAPVIDEQQRFLGFIDMKDLVQFVVYAVESEGVEIDVDLLKKTHVTSVFGKNGFVDIALTGAAKMYSDPIKGITTKYLSQKHAHAFIDYQASLLDVCILLAKGNNRVAVLDNNRKVVNLISQSAVIQLLNQHAAILTNDFAKAGTVSSISKPVITVSENTKSIDALRIMSTKNISGLPILSDGGNWIATITSSDLKLIGKYSFGDLLQQPIINLICWIRQHDVGNARNPTISVAADSTLQHVIAKLAATKIHRLFVVESQTWSHKPIGVVSLTDILHVLLSPQ